MFSYLVCVPHRRDVRSTTSSHVLKCLHLSAYVFTILNLLVCGHLLLARTETFAQELVFNDHRVKPHGRRTIAAWCVSACSPEMSMRPHMLQMPRAVERSELCAIPNRQN